MILYGLQHSCMTLKNNNRIDAWQARQLRRVIGIKASYYSRTTNDIVLKQADTTTFSQQILANQIKYLGRILRAEDHETIKTITLTKSRNYRTLDSHRRKGHPRAHWLPTLTQDIDELIHSTPSHLPHSFPTTPSFHPTFFPYAALSHLAADFSQWSKVCSLPTRRLPTLQTQHGDT